MSLQELISNPYADNLANSRPCGKLSKALLRSIATVPTIWWLSMPSFHSSIILISVDWQLYLRLKPEKNLEKSISKYENIWELKTFTNILDTAASILTGLYFFFMRESSFSNRAATSAFLRTVGNIHCRIDRLIICAIGTASGAAPICKNLLGISSNPVAFLASSLTSILYNSLTVT